MMSVHSLASCLAFFSFIYGCAARNVALTSRGVAVATREDNGIVSRFRATGRLRRQSLPDGIRSLDDISIDTENEELLFSISVSSRRICSFRIRGRRRPALIGCVGSNIPVSPFTGISARGGTLVVSGGTGGLTIFRYDAMSGVISASPIVRALQLENVVGHPDVVMMSPSLIALSTDFRAGFGTLLVSVSNGGQVQTIGNYIIAGSSGFSNIVGPANFPLVSASFGERFLYTANGVMTAADTTRLGRAPTPIAIPSGVPLSFEAVTVSVDESERKVYFGGISTERGSSVVLCFDISSSPLSPTFERSFSISGRITSMASNNDRVAVVVRNTSGVRFLDA